MSYQDKISIIILSVLAVIEIAALIYGLVKIHIERKKKKK